MLLRGQNIVGYRHYADDVLEHFIERAAANGIDVFRRQPSVKSQHHHRTTEQAQLADDFALRKSPVQGFQSC